MNKRKSNGKSAARNAFVPKKNAKAPNHMQTMARTKSDCGFVSVRCHRFTWDAVSNIAPGTSRATPIIKLNDRIENTDFLLSKIRNALTSGMSGI